FLHGLQDESESLEVGTLGGSQWVCLEERHHSIDELAAPLHREAEQHLSMIEWSVLLDDAPAPEHPLEEFERRPRGCSLGDGEFVLDLPAEPTPGFRTTEIEKHPSPSTKPTTHCSAPGLSC
ncbi:MAG TPA: hypothetical protein VM715_16815, partial [Candidatus Acidoferrum sp.]|nr:hypothetical protein [Candidatus Acidoferrum sp.]